MTRDEFLAEVARRGYRRESLFFLPGPDEGRNPEGGGVIVEAPSARTNGQWRAYKHDRGIKHDARFATESEAYEHVLHTILSDPSQGRAPLTREQFLADVERRGGRASWFVFLPEDAGRDTTGRIVVEHATGGWRVYRGDDGSAAADRFASESEALRHVLGSLLGRPA